MLDLSRMTPVLQGGYAYWRRKCAGRRMPTRAEIDPAEIVPLLPHVVLMDVLRDPPDFRYRLLGTTVDAHMSARHTGRRLSEIPHQREPSQMWRNFSHVAERGEPLATHVPYVGPHKDFLAVQDLIMPLGGDGRMPNMLFILVDFVPRFGMRPHTISA